MNFCELSIFLGHLCVDCVFALLVQKFVLKFVLEVRLEVRFEVSFKRSIVCVCVYKSYDDLNGSVLRSCDVFAIPCFMKTPFGERVPLWMLEYVFAKKKK